MALSRRSPARAAPGHTTANDNTQSRAQQAISAAGNGFCVGALQIIAIALGSITRRRLTPRSGQYSYLCRKFIALTRAVYGPLATRTGVPRTLNGRGLPYVRDVQCARSFRHRLHPLEIAWADLAYPGTQFRGSKRSSFWGKPSILLAEMDGAQGRHLS